MINSGTIVTNKILKIRVNQLQKVKVRVNKKLLDNNLKYYNNEKKKNNQKYKSKIYKYIIIEVQIKYPLLMKQLFAVFVMIY